MNPLLDNCQNSMDPTIVRPSPNKSKLSIVPFSNIEIADVSSIQSNPFQSSADYGDARTSANGNNVGGTSLSLHMMTNIPSLGDLEKSYSIDDYDKYFEKLDSDAMNKSLVTPSAPATKSTKSTAKPSFMISSVSGGVKMPNTPASTPPASAAAVPATSNVAAVIDAVAINRSRTPQDPLADPDPAGEPSTSANSVSPEPTVSSSTTTTTNIQVTNTKRTEQLQNEIDKAAYALVKGTGLEGTDLYRCAVPGCEGAGADSIYFNVHLLKHTNSGQKGFKCYHCSLTSKNIVGLKYHIKVHGIHRYFCYYCDFTGPIMNYTLKHMNDTHKKIQVVTFALNPKKTDQNKDMFVICPRGVYNDELNRFGLKLLDRYKHKMATTKKFYSPDELDMLPRQPIFNDLLLCSVCNFSTKVRTNLHRHLEKHVQNQAVPKQNPVNPVPCLDKGEKLFDKMINFASSSNEDRAGPSGSAAATNPYDQFAYVTELRRFICGATGCRYQTINEIMLRNHLNTLHANEQHYKCPHCNVEICRDILNSVAIGQHLRMHDSKLYRCVKCSYRHYDRQIVVAHVDERHPGSRADTIAEETRMGAPAVTETATAPGASTTISKTQMWQCSLCYSKHTSKQLVRQHLSNAHSITYRYQCDICQELQSNTKSVIMDHMQSAHATNYKRVRFFYSKTEEYDTTPIWRRDDPNKVKHVRGILFEDEPRRYGKGRSPKKSLKVESGLASSDVASLTSSLVPTVTAFDIRPETDPATNHTDDDDDDDDVQIVEPTESDDAVIISDEDSPPSLTPEVVSKVKLEQYVCGTCNSFQHVTVRAVEEHHRGEHSGRPFSVLFNGQSSQEATATVTPTVRDATVAKYRPAPRSVVNARTVDAVAASTTVITAVAPPSLPSPSIPPPSLPSPSIAPPSIPPPAVKTYASFDRNIVYICYHCVHKSPHIGEIYNHWKEAHKSSKTSNKNITFAGRPFLFKITKIVQCYHCLRTGTYNDIKLHNFRVHQGKQFACVDMGNLRRCGECVFTYKHNRNEILAHYEKEHAQAAYVQMRNEPYDYLTDAFLTKLLTVGYTDGEYKCRWCDEPQYRYKDDYDAHHDAKHPGKDKQFDRQPSGIEYGCSTCRDALPDERSMIKHIREHDMQYQCKFCEKTFQYLKMIKQHHEILHQSTDETFRNVDVKKNLDTYLNMRITFPNGLILSKGDVKLTKYGQIGTVLDYVTELNAEELQQVKDRQEEAAKLELERQQKVSPKTKVRAKNGQAAKKKTPKRKQTSSGDSDSSDDFVVSRRKRKSASRRSRIIDSESDDDNSSVGGLAKAGGGAAAVASPSSEDEPLIRKVQRDTVLSHYGMKPKSIDLNAVFTYMNICGTEMRVPCSRLSLLFDIHPRLQLTSIDDEFGYAESCRREAN